MNPADPMDVDDGSESDEIEGLLWEWLDEDDDEAVIAALALGGHLHAGEGDWYDDPDKPWTFEAACRRLDDRHVEHFSRFKEPEIDSLAAGLGVPARIFCHGAGYCDGKLALLMTLTRLAHPFRMKTLEFIFGYHHKRVNRWTNYMIQWLFYEWNHLLQLNLERFGREAPRYAAAFGAKLGYADPTRCRNILQVDGCFLEICHPKYSQELFYNGHYKGHGLKFEVCMGATRLLESVFGPVVGHTHDITLWRTSGVARDIDALRAMAIFPGEAGAQAEEPDNMWFAVGDSAYKGGKEHVLVPFDRSRPLTRDQRTFNRQLAATRIPGTLVLKFGVSVTGNRPR